MTALDATRLRRLLQEHITERYEVTEILEFEDEMDPQGQPIPHRESALRRWEGRLARLRQIAPDRADIHRDHEAIIAALQALSPESGSSSGRQRVPPWSIMGCAPCAALFRVFQIRETRLLGREPNLVLHRMAAQQPAWAIRELQEGRHQ